MTAPTNAFNVPTDAELTSGKPLTQERMRRIAHSILHLWEWMGGGGFTAAIAHNHDGVNSAEIEIGPNSVRNGSFESGTTGYTIIEYAGGTVTTNTANDMDGATCLAITSTNLTTGGGEALQTGYTPVAGGRQVDVGGMVKASVANVSSKLSVIWYDDAKANISESTVYSSTSTSTSALPVANRMTAPAAARYMRVKVVGGVPATGSATGTIYWDGLFATAVPDVAIPGSSVAYGPLGNIDTTATTATETINTYLPMAGVYTVSWSQYCVTGDGIIQAVARVYVNGVAYSSEQGTVFGTDPGASFSFDVAVPANSTIQIFQRTTNAAKACRVKNFSIKAGNYPAMVPLGSIIDRVIGWRAP